jgi:predicted aconitase
MDLTEVEQKMLDGKNGPGCRFAMELLVAVGDAFGAEKMVPVRSAHTILSTYKGILDAGVEAMERFVALGAKAVIPTTTDPAGMDLERWIEFRVPEDYARKQFRIVKAVHSLGLIPCWTCTPYLAGLLPQKGDHLAWTESSAVVFANSMIGACTNRETAVIDIAAAVTGRTPEHGLHLKRNRLGNVRMDVQMEEMSAEDYRIFGYFMGKKAGARIPVITGLRRTDRIEDYIAMGAAAAASGGVALYHIVGITPEAGTLEEAFGGNEPEKSFRFSPAEREQTKQDMCTVRGGDIEAVMVGCPHYTITDIKRVAELLEGKSVRKGAQFWIYTYKGIELLAERMGYKTIIEKAGAKITSDTCMMISPTELWRFKTIMTDSGKFAYYAPSQVQADVVFGSIEECVTAAVDRRRSV